MILRRALSWLILLCLTVLGAPSQASEPHLVPMAVLADPQGTETIASISTPARKGDFTPVTRGFSAGYTRTVHWLRLELAPPDDTAGPALLEIQPPYLDDLRLYLPDAGVPGAFIEKIAGDRYPFAMREFAYRGFVFHVDFPAGQPVTAYVRLETSSSSVLVANLWRNHDFNPAKVGEYTFLGLYYGILLTIFAINLWHGVWRKDRLFQFYLMFIGSSIVLFSGTNGLLAQFGPNERPWLGDQATSVGTLLVSASSAWFYRQALSITPQATPAIVWVYRLVQWLPLLCLPLLWFDLFPELMQVLAPSLLVMTVCGLWRSLWLWKTNSTGSHFMVMAHAFTLSGGTVILLVLMGWIPSGLWILHSYQIGNLASLLALNLALFAILRVRENERVLALQRVATSEQALLDERHARKEQSRFMAMLSHEIKTPLAIINAATDSLRDLSADTSAPVVLRYDRIQLGVTRIDQIINQLLNQDRLSDSSLQLHRQPIDLRRLCLDSCDDPRLHLHLAKGATFDGDAELIAIAINNLLQNALRYSPADTPVDLTLELDGEYIQISVMDRGPGVSEPDRERIFERYVRASTVGHIPGAGLGLNLVRRICQLHGGEVTYAPRSGGGACFYMRLPRTPSALQTISQ